MPSMTNTMLRTLSRTDKHSASKCLNLNKIIIRQNVTSGRFECDYAQSRVDYSQSRVDGEFGLSNVQIHPSTSD